MPVLKNVCKKPTKKARRQPFRCFRRLCIWKLAGASSMLGEELAMFYVQVKVTFQ